MAEMNTIERFDIVARKSRILPASRWLLGGKMWSTHSRSCWFRLQTASSRVFAASAALIKAGPGFDETARLSRCQSSRTLSEMNSQNGPRSPAGTAARRASCSATCLGRTGGVGKDDFGDDFGVSNDIRNWPLGDMRN